MLKEATNGPETAQRRQGDSNRRVADSLLEALEVAGVETIFGLPGGPIAPLHDALLENAGIRHVTCRHEMSAVFAACGYARCRGRVGVALVTSGPGLLNALTGLAAAHCDGLPVLLLVGEVPRTLHGRGALQDGSAYHLNVLGMTRSISKLSVEVPDPHAAVSTVKRAMATAVSGRRGPVVVTVPMDILSAEVTPSRVAHSVGMDFALDPVILQQVTDAVAKSGRGVIFAGNGTRWGLAPTALRQLAETLQWPVMTTPKGKGVFPETHPLSLGVFGMGGHPSTAAFLESGVETVVAVGTSLGDLATDGWSDLLKPSRAFVHIDIDAAQVGRSYSANLTITAPAEPVLRELLSRLGPPNPTRSFGVTTYDEARDLSPPIEGKISPARAVKAIQQIMPKQTIYTVDSGEHYFFATHYLAIDDPSSYIVMTGLGSMGSGICSAVGAQLAMPGRTVASICGDGGLAMVAGEIATAAAEGAPVHFFVFNDQRLGMVELGHAALYQRSPKFDTCPMDVAALGRAMGADAYVVESEEDLFHIPIRGLGDRKPLVVDIRIDRGVTMPKNRRFENLKKIGASSATRKEELS